MKKPTKISCPDCNGTGWQEVAPYDDGSRCENICIHCEGFGKRFETEADRIKRLRELDDE